MTFTAIWNVITKIIDICLVWIMFYFIFKNIKNNVKMVLIFKGVIIIILIKILSNILDLYTIGLLLEYVLSWGPIALIVIFQPEIRNVLESIGRSQLLGRHKVLTGDEREKIVFEIMTAIEYLKKNRIVRFETRENVRMIFFFASCFSMYIPDKYVIATEMRMSARYEGFQQA